MGEAYVDELLPDRHAVLMLMQGYAAAGSDPEIQAHVRSSYGDVVSEVAELSGAPPDEVWSSSPPGCSSTSSRRWTWRRATIRSSGHGPPRRL